MWNIIRNNHDIYMLMNQVDEFHDSYIVGLSYQSSKYLVSQSSKYNYYINNLYFIWCQ